LLVTAPPLRFCLALTHGRWARAADPRAEVARTIAQARLADEAGLDAIMVSEDPDGWDAFAVLSALARATERVRLGTGVTNPYLRHPNLIAASVSTLDRLSGGRAFLGLGRGQAEWYERAFGMATGKPLAVLEETVELLRAWWRPPYRASARGVRGDAPHFPIDNWERSVGPIQDDPPIYLAAVGPKTLALTGRIADGLIVNDLASSTFIEHAITAVRSAAGAAGRNGSSFSIFVRDGITVTDNPEPILERRKATIATIHALPGMERLLEAPGFDTEKIIAEVRRHMRTDEVLAQGGGFADLRRAGDLEAAKAAIPTDLVAQLALVGPVSDLRERLRGLAALGVTHVFLSLPSPNASADEIAQTIATLTQG
jgi:5,10-methylenetetrahydromethanopterin reductase